MEQTGRVQKRLNELDEIVSGFSSAMRMADPKYVAENGRFTPKMQIFWNRFVGWCYEHEKESL